MRSLERELAGRDVKIEMAEKLPLARLDFTLMQQALANLLLNAAVHTPAGTPILIQARQEKERIDSVRRGQRPGSAAGFAARGFLTNFSARPNAPAGGSGLGLAIVKGFVEAHGGQISAANRPGGGAMFTIKIPQTEKPPSETRHEN